jgi:hypothetical protein
MRFSWEALDLHLALRLHARAHRLEQRAMAEKLAPLESGILDFGPGYYLGDRPLLPLLEQPQLHG